MSPSYGIRANGTLNIFWVVLMLRFLAKKVDIYVDDVVIIDTAGTVDIPEIRSRELYL